VPLGIFSAIALTALGIMLAIVTFIESGVVAVGGTVLAGVLALCLGFSTVVVGTLSMCWFGYRSIRFVWNTGRTIRREGVMPEVPPARRPLSEELAKTGQAMKQAIATPVTSITGYSTSSGSGMTSGTGSTEWGSASQQHK
jgi:hypothetical protein